jgi:hypothetical protein
MTRSDPANKFHLLWYLHSVRLPPVIFSPRHFLRVSNTWAAEVHRNTPTTLTITLAGRGPANGYLQI